MTFSVLLAIANRVWLHKHFKNCAYNIQLGIMCYDVRLLRILKNKRKISRWKLFWSAFSTFPLNFRNYGMCYNIFSNKKPCHALLYTLRTNGTMGHYLVFGGPFPFIRSPAQKAIWLWSLKLHIRNTELPATVILAQYSRLITPDEKSLCMSNS